MERFQITVRFVSQAPLSIAGPGRTVPLVDRSIEVDEEGLPFIPASSVRGRVRAHFERLVKALDEPVCSPPRPDRVCPHNLGVVEQLKTKGTVEPFCLACRIFGSPWRDSTVNFSDFHVVEEQRTLLYQEPFPLRTGISLSRHLGTVQPEKLFVTETTPAIAKDENLAFDGAVDGLLNRREIGLLIAALRSVIHIGGNKARGLGRIKVDVRKLEFWDDNARKWMEESWEKILAEL